MPNNSTGQTTSSVGDSDDSEGRLRPEASCLSIETQRTSYLSTRSSRPASRFSTELRYGSALTPASRLSVESRLDSLSSGMVPASRTSNEAGLGYRPASPNQANNLLDDRGRKQVSKQFQSKTALSTFFCMLILSYIAFTTTMASGQRTFASGIPYNLGTLLALLAIQLHAVAIVLSCQRIALCNSIARCYSEEFRNSLAVCGSLQFAGSSNFILAVMGSSCLFFEHYSYVAIFFAISLAGLVSFLYGSGALSKAHSDILVIIQLLKPRNNIGQDVEANKSSSFR